MEITNLMLLTGILALSVSARGAYADTPAQTAAKDLHTSTQKMKEHAKPFIEKYDGTIEQVDTKSGWVTVKQASGKSVNVPLGKSTSIGIDGKPADVGNIAVGEKAQVEEESYNGHLVHTVINILSTRKNAPVSADKAAPAIKKHSKEFTHNYEGMIQQIDTKTGWLTVKQSNGKTVNIPLKSTTSIGVDGKAGEVSALAVGKKVQVQEESEKGKLTHTTVNVLA